MYVLQKTAKKDHHPQQRVKYLGARARAGGNLSEGIEAWQKAAGIAHGRLAVRTFRSDIELELIVCLWKSLARSTALCALAVMLPCKGSAAKLERWQSRMLRRSVRTSAHVARR